MKQLSLKHKIALVELVVLIILGCYFFLPKSFSQAMGKGFDPDQVTAVTVQLEGARGKRGEEHTFTSPPPTPSTRNSSTGWRAGSTSRCT
ncbi:MAG: hypothetical protein ACLUNZ_02145 [Evtepia sp.]